MLWLFLILRRTYTARTGVWPFDFPFACMLCSAQSTARVFAEATASHTSMNGGGEAYAYALAQQQLPGVAQSAFSRAACPHCGKFAPAVTGYADHQAAARAESERTRFFWALGVAGVLLLLGLGGAGLDKSGWVALTALGIAIAAFLITLYVKTPNGAAVRIVHPQNVSFWWNGVWATPNAVYVPPIDATKKRGALLSALCVTGALVGGIGSLVTIAIWASTWHAIHVINTEHEGALTVWIDGKNAGTVAPESIGKDTGVESFTLRTGPHTVEVKDQNGALVEKQDLEVDPADQAYFLAPRAKENGACVVKVVSSYATYKTAPAPTELVIPDPLFRMKFDQELVDSPSSVQMQSGQTETQQIAVRVFQCKSGRVVHGDNGEGVPFTRH